jgi:hypothetical protein
MYINRGPLIILVALSVATYQRCRLARRNPFLWIPLLWLVALACGIVGQLAVMQVVADDAPAPRVLLGWGEAIGQIAGAAIVTFLAGRRSLPAATAADSN